MFMANILSGFSMAEADTLRKAIGKKNAETMAKMKDRFITGAVERGYDKEKIESLWNDIEKFASYSFNKSHSTAYAYLTYWTAYIKTYYPEEFFMVKLSTENNDTKFLNLLLDMENFDIQLLPPDINKSKADFYIEDNKKIRYGLKRIKNVGEETAKEIEKEREQNGNYKDLFDIASRLDSKVVNKRVLEALIKAGAFDFEKIPRWILFANVDKVLEAGQKERESKLAGQVSLFSVAPSTEKVKHSYDTNNIKEWTEKEKLSYEKEVLGFYLSGHPINAYKKELRNKERIPRISDIQDIVLSSKEKDEEEIENKNFTQREKYKLAGIITDLKFKKTKNGNLMAVFTLQDESGNIDCRAFPDKMENKDLLKEDTIVIVEGFIDVDEEQDAISMTVNNIEPIEKIHENIRALRIKLTKEKALNSVSEKIKELFLKHKGDKEVIIEIYDKNKPICEIMLHSDFHINPTEEFKNELLKILSENEYRFE